MRKVLLGLLVALLAFGAPVGGKSPEELEARILEKIFTDLLGKEKVRVLILGDKERTVSKRLRRFSEKIDQVGSCEDADLVLLAGRLKGGLPEVCGDKPLFSLRREDVFKFESCVGAFYWKKGRPNILLIRERLEERKLYLPPEYNRYMESFRSLSLRSGGGM